jgi:hypothetical protein
MFKSSFIIIYIQASRPNYHKIQASPLEYDIWNNDLLLRVKNNTAAAEG